MMGGVSMWSFKGSVIGVCNVGVKLTRVPGVILDLRPANERRRYKLTASLIGWAQT